MIKYLFAALLGMLMAFAGSAARADESAWAGTLVATPPNDNVYVWADGAYQNIDLPKFSLGFINQDTTGAYDGASLSSKPNPTGGGFRGGLGYFIPGGGMWPSFGMNQRIEIGGFYVHASSSDTQSTNAGAGNVTLLLMNGTQLFSSVACGFGFAVCPISGQVSTSYNSWGLDAKYATDFALGTVTVTPSIALVGGRTSADQTLAQQFGTTSDFYSSSTSLGWTDVGAKLGLDGHIDITNWLAVGLGGSVAGVGRWASLSASDAGMFGSPLTTGSIGQGKSTTAFVGNIEAGLVVKPLPALALRVFGGVNYDNDVPGISSPSYTGAGFPFTSITPANISFHGETSYYFGAGAIWRF
jgi:hypothetical protein